MRKEIKSAEETNEERQTRIYPIILNEYNPDWLEWYAEEKENLERLIDKENITRISHFGSTAVPGLMAKPTVDILIEISDDAVINELIASLSTPDYIYLHKESAPTISTPSLHLMFLKGYLSDGFAEKVYHIHVVRSGDWDEKLCFRDYLISHPEAAAEYAELKRNLIKDYKHYRDGYTEAKGAFIKGITEKAMESL
ncbi:MAG: GrpB family protein [Eubacteriales bacterium]|nr:GrpB family protein [Eubacteriales bacterium]